MKEIFTPAHDWSESMIAARAAIERAAALLRTDDLRSAEEVSQAIYHLYAVRGWVTKQMMLRRGQV